MATRKVDKHNMTNNKQQTEINAVEYLDKVHQFAKENNTDKPRQQTAVEWLEQEMLKPNLSMKEILEQAQEMEKDQHIKSWEAGLMKVDFNEYYKQTYGGDKL